MKKLLIFLGIFIVSITTFTGCMRQVAQVSYNISKEADNFNIQRRLSVINARTDKPVFELVGYFSVSNNYTNELEITCQTGQNEYKKHYVYLNEWTIYIIEDVSGASVTPYHYEINFLPEMIKPFTFTSSY